MYGEEHFLSKIERNAFAVDHADEAIKNECIKNVIWARDLAKRLDNLDYEEREKAIQKIHETMDNDYIKMGYEINNSNIKKGM